MKKHLLFAIVALGLSSHALASSKSDYPPISFVVPGGGSSQVDKTQFLILVIEAGFIMHEGSPIPAGGVVAYVNNAMKAQSASFLGVHVRQGVKFGELLRALDDLRKTEAKSIGVSMVELPHGKEP